MSQTNDDLSITNQTSLLKDLNSSTSSIPYKNKQINDSISSRASSPFILNPEIMRSFHNQGELTYEDAQNDMDNSILNLQTSLNNLKINTNSLKSLPQDLNKVQSNDDNDYEPANVLNMKDDEDEITNEVSMESTRFNETRLQFDKDIDLDLDVNKSDNSSRISSKISSRSRSSPISSTPWRNLRSASSIPTNLPPAPNLRFSPVNLNKPGQDSSSINTINELNKQLTGYKIQIKFFKQFLQKLIQTKQFDEIIDDNDLQNFQNFPSLSPIKGTTNSSNIKYDFLKNNKHYELEYNKLDREHKELMKNYDEVYKLNEDLYLNIETFQHELQQSDRLVNELSSQILTCHQVINEIIQTLIDDNLTDSNSRNSLTRVMENDDSIELKLQVIKMEINKKQQQFQHQILHQPSQAIDKESKRNSFSSESTKLSDKEYELNSYIKTIHQLMTTLEALKLEFDDQKNLTSNIENALQFEIEQSMKLKSNYDLIKKSFESFTTKNNQLKKLENNNNSELIKLRLENEKLLNVNSNVNSKFEQYQQVIDNLQAEVNEFKNLHHSNSQLNILNTSELNEELLQSHKDFNNLQQEYNDLHDKYIKLKQDTSEAVSSLTNQLSNKTNENSNYKADKLVIEKLQQDLNLAVEKQRILKAEKIRLSYKVESLTKDKISLQTTIQNLTDKVTTLTVSADQAVDSELNATNASLIKKINILEYQIRELLQLDVLKFQKLLKSFNKIADDISLKEPTRKIDYMTSKLIPTNASTDSNISEVDFTDMTSVRDYHKSVFDYFARAIDIIVNDHVKLLLKENETDLQNTEYVNKLHKRIEELNKLNDDLTKLVDSMENTMSNDYNDTSISSPRSKLRIDELTNRWKAEREARVYENNEANKRLKELELENSRLRHQLSPSTIDI